MAIEYFSSIDLNQNEIQQPVIHVTGTISDSDGVKGQLYTHSSNNTLLFHNGSEFIDLTAGDIQGVTAGNGLSGGGTTGTIDLAVDLNELATETSIAQADFVAMVDATDNGSGKITFSNFEDTIFSNMNSASSDVAVAAGGAITLANDCVDSAEIADGAVDNVHLSGSIANNKLAFSTVQIGASTVALGSALDSLTDLTDIDLTSGNKTIFDGIGSNTLTMGASGTTILIPGNLTVSGDTIYSNDTIRIVADNTLEFEGAAGTSASHELKLTTGVLGGDRIVTLPDATGTVALTSDITGTNSGTNTGDQLVFKTVSTDSGSAVADTTTDTLTLSGGAGIDTSASADTITIAAETATDGNAGIVTLASDSNALAGSGGGVVSAAQVASRYKTATIAASSVNAASNKRAFINHALGTYDIIVDLYLDSATLNYAKVHAEVTRTSDGSTDSTNHITIDFGNNIPADVKVVIASARGADAISPTYG